ncbi:Cu(I)-responsive transcriptional regulator [Aureimonas endophytica]|uniref:Cu(I)-responsive transcriptional regulator n=1 Tax=Aureimonas endophytica TaxID=2027858 RepID=A0A916ZWR0_9HYPH|nr:Cu(I)-responsive transcriptional regulator [Aureimonas endophytica]GGE16254.1 Cu(I)-responsive transcriptional regulator [Aureimonas endophytica]
MNIGEASRRSGLPPKTIRYYEEVGLVRPARAQNGYRDYRERDVHMLRFLQRSRSLGFSIEEARKLLALYADDRRHSEDVRAMAHRRIAEIDRKIEELRSLKRALGVLAEQCPGDGGPDCPILDEIAGGALPLPSEEKRV